MIVEVEETYVVKVWIVTGWYGDQEWTEGVYATEAGAELAADDLRQHRQSPNGPQWTFGYQKFGVDEWEVK